MKYYKPSVQLIISTDYITVNNQYLIDKIHKDFLLKLVSIFYEDNYRSIKYN